MTALNNLGVNRPAGYQLPGTYEQRVPGEPQAAAANSVTIPCVIATGSRQRTYTDFPLVRGQVTNEALTLTADSGAYIATLATGAGALRDTTTLSVSRTLNGTTVVIPRTAVSFRPAVVTGSVTTNLNLALTAPANGGVAFGLVSDGGPAGVTFLLRYGAAQAVTVAGRQVIVDFPFGGTLGDAATIANVVSALNAAFVDANVQALGFSSAWTASASVASNALRITTPSSLTNRGLRIVPAAAGITGATLTPLTSTSLFGSATLTAPTVVQITEDYYDALATYTATYVANGDTSDELSGTNPRVRRVGSFVGSADFVGTTDYSLSGTTLSWAGLSAAVLQSSNTANMDLSVNDRLALTVDSQSLIGVDFIQSSPITARVISGGLTTATLSSATVVGFATGLTPNNVSAVQAAQQINAILAWAYGPDYASVASVVGGGVRVTSRVTGNAGSVQVTIDPSLATSAAAVTAVFGSANPAGTLVTGSGRAPQLGSVYYVTYDAVRPTNEYNVPVLLTSAQDIAPRFGSPETAVPGLNPLAQALDYALNTVGVPAVYAIQINDAIVVGLPSAPEIQAALNAAVQPSDIGGIVLFGADIGASSTSIAALISHLGQTRNIETQKLRRIYVAPSASTPLGSSDTPGSARFLAARTLQVAADSPSRGSIFCSYWATQPVTGTGTGVRRVVSLDGGRTSVTVECGHEWLALWTCLTRESIAVAATLGGRTVPGFDLSNARAIDSTLLKSALGSGLCAASIDTGVPLIVEGLTVEQGGAGDASFTLDSNSTQSDAVSRRVRRAIDGLRYLVPERPSDIVDSVEKAIEGALQAAISSGEIAPYTNAVGAARAPDSTDYRVILNNSDTREVFYSYGIVLRAPFLRAFGKSIAVLTSR